MVTKNPTSAVAISLIALLLGFLIYMALKSAAAHLRAAKLRSVRMDSRAAMLVCLEQSPPPNTSGMKPALDRLLAPVLERGVLAAETGAGLVIGILDRGVQEIYAYGAAKEDSIFEIGSVTKTFTGLALAQMIAQKQVTLDQPVRELLPSAAVSKPAGAEITLLDLVTQRSGLPRLPNNLSITMNNPYAHYGSDRLYRYLRKRGLAKPAGAQFEYSNLGFGLLGQVLARRAGMSYEELIRRQVCEPLGMTDTAVTLSRAQKTRLIPGHNRANKPCESLDFKDDLAVCGALRSTASDLLRYVDANLHPEQFARMEAEPNSPAGTLPEAIVLSHQEHGDAQGSFKIAFAWMYVPQTLGFWHNGGTGGYTAEILFNVKKNRGIVVLHNRNDITRLRSKPKFSSEVLENVVRLMNSADQR